MASLINGWTRDAVVARIDERFKGKSVTQDAPSICAYRNGEGLCCITGCFISDEDYDKFFNGVVKINYEGEGVWDLCDDIKNKFPFGEMWMAKWQAVHDNMDYELTAEEQKQLLIDALDKILEATDDQNKT